MLGASAPAPPPGTPLAGGKMEERSSRGRQDGHVKIDWNKVMIVAIIRELMRPMKYDKFKRT